MMEMDATQALIYSDEESEAEDDTEGNRKVVAILKVLAQKNVSEIQHNIYEGSNFIGRHDSNSIHMPYKALSKQHACIEVSGDTHLIYDMESRNRTRRGKMFLKPNVRYELRYSDTLTFGDVKCEYAPSAEEEPVVEDSGSDTDSDLMLQPPDPENTAVSDAKSSQEDENENDSSFNLNDLLQPTQACVESPKLQFKTPKRLNIGKVFAAESDDDSPEKTFDGDDSFIPDTQQSARKKNTDTVVQESDSDTDIEDTAPFDVSAMAAAPTQAVENIETQAVENMETQAVENMETQAVENMETQALENMETQVVENMETQAVNDGPTTAKGRRANVAIEDEQTQAVGDVDIENAATLAVGQDEMTTQAFAPDSDSSDTDLEGVRQSLLDAPTQAFGPMDSDEDDEEKEKGGRGNLSGPTLVLESSVTSSDAEDSPIKQIDTGRNLYEEPTQPCDGVVSDSDSDTDVEGAIENAETQAVLPDGAGLDDMATVPIPADDEDSTDHENGDSNLVRDSTALEGTVKVDEGLEDMATVPISKDSEDEYDDDTDVEGGGGMDNVTEAATVAIDDMMDTATDDDEVASKENEESVSGDKPFKRYAHSEPDPATAAVEEKDALDATQQYGALDMADSKDEDEEDAVRRHGDDVTVDATQPYGDQNEPASPKPQAAAASESDEIEATQAYGTDEVEEEEEKKDVQKPKNNEVLDPTLPYGAEDDVAMETEESEVESTQAYGMQGGDTQVADSQEGDTDDTAPSSRFPVFETQSPTRSCLKQKQKVEKEPLKARRVTFESSNEDSSEEEEIDLRRTRGRTPRSRSDQTNKTKAKPAPCAPMQTRKTATVANSGAETRRSSRSRTNDLEEAGDADGGRTKRATGRNSKQPQASPQVTESGRQRGRRSKQNKAEEEIDGELDVTVPDAAPTRKKSFDEENPRPTSRRGSKVKDTSSVSSAEGEVGSETGKGTLGTLTKIGQKLQSLRSGRKKGAAKDEAGISTDAAESARKTRAAKSSEPFIARGDDEESDDTASLSSTSSSIKDLAEVETGRRSSRRGAGKGSGTGVDHLDGPQSAKTTRSRRAAKIEVVAEAKASPQDEKRASRRSGRNEKVETTAKGAVSTRGKSKSKADDDEELATNRAKRTNVRKGGSASSKLSEETSTTASPSEPVSRSSRRSTRGTAQSQDDAMESQEETVRPTRSAKRELEQPKETKDARRQPTTPGNKRKLEQEKVAPVSDSQNQSTFAVPKPVTRAVRQKKQQGDGAPHHQEAAADTSSAETGKRGRRSVTVATASDQQAESSSKATAAGNESTKTAKKLTVPSTTANNSKDQRPSRRGKEKLEDDEQKTEQVVNRRTKRAAEDIPTPTSAKKAKQATLSPHPSVDPSSSPARTPGHHSSPQTAASPSLRRRTSEVKPKVIFTGVTDASWQKTVTTLGGELVDSVHGCTHLVTDKVRRTVKFLCCVAQGCLIVTPAWLEKSKASKAFVDPQPFLLIDKASEKQHRFTLSASLQKAGQTRLLKGYKVHVTQGVKPEPPHMKDIIKCAGGEYLAKMPTKSTPKAVVVSCETDKSLWSVASRAGIPVVSSEFILTGILRQEILLDQFKLS
ncbi:uncharacterized protein [Diadema antillarum]|uniref:uncharacterized protein n=1 Tax=Diadema antillarum TaxID=105358 RepID=UPI003A87B922